MRVYLLLGKLRTLVNTYIKKIVTFCLQADHVELPCQIRMKVSNITEDEVSNYTPHARLKGQMDKRVHAFHAKLREVKPRLGSSSQPPSASRPTPTIFTSTKSLQVHLLLVIQHTLDSLRDDFLVVVALHPL